MRSLSAITAAVGAVATLVALGQAPSGGAATAAPESFAFAIGNGMLRGDSGDVAARLGDFDLVVVDGELAKRDETAALRARGATVLAYLSVGTIEKWRSWYRKLKPYRLHAWQDWRDEWYADTSRRKLRRALSRRIAPRILAKGFDGLFLDNVDMVEARRFRRQRTGMRKLVRKLARLVDDREELLYAQNGFRIMRKLGIADHLDGWNREDVTSTYNFDRKRYRRTRANELGKALDHLRQMRAAGLVVTATDYTKGNDAATAADAVANACSVGALPYVGDIGLTARRLPDPPLVCP